MISPNKFTVYCDFSVFGLIFLSKKAKSQYVVIFLLQIFALSAAGAEGGGAETVDGHHYEADEGEHK